MAPKAAAKPARVHKGARFGRPFDATKRAAFLALVREGHSTSYAAPAVRISRTTVKEWLRSGRSGRPEHPEHRRFAEDFEEAEAVGTVEAYSKLNKLAETDSKALVALLKARGVPGFGLTVSEQRRKNAADVKIRELEAELAAVRLANERDGKVEPTVLVIVERDLGGDG